MGIDEKALLKISRILHAGYVFESSGVKIVFDPLFENPFSHNAHAFPAVHFDRDTIRKLKFTAIFISHYHDDHWSLESLDLMDRETPIYAYCIHDEFFSLMRKLGFKTLIPLDLDGVVSIGPFEIQARRALDQDVDSIFHIKVLGLNILNVVDSWIDDEMLESLAGSAPWDLVLWPFQSMREIEVITPRAAVAADGDIPDEHQTQLRTLAPKVLVPSACQFKFEPWSWYNLAFFSISYKSFADQIKALLPDVQVLRMDPGVSYTSNGKTWALAEPLPWIQHIGEQGLDYQYDPGLVPPTTPEIAHHFLPLTPLETERVLEYCHSGLIERFQNLESPSDVYFQEPVLWRLRLYDEAGRERSYHYWIRGNRMELAEAAKGELGWTTELPIQKLFAALFRGETLTSLYIRINDQEFPEAIRSKLEAVDVVEDPLLRCLYTGIFAAYQKAQLERLAERCRPKGASSKSERCQLQIRKVPGPNRFGPGTFLIWSWHLSAVSGKTGGDFSFSPLHF